MDEAKAAIAHDYFTQIESQVQFGDNKASLLIAGDAILLAIAGGVLDTLSGCGTGQLAADCAVMSAPLVLAAAGALLLVLSLAAALWAARPARRHVDPPREFFLLSYVAKLPRGQFVQWFQAAAADELTTEMLISIHGKAQYATRKFYWLKHAIHATLLSLGFLLAAVVAAAVR